MGVLDRFRRGGARGKRVRGARSVSGEDARYLAEWVRTHSGVEAFIEPRTAVTEVTAVLVAADGEWTRRVVGELGAKRLASDLRIPVYDVAKVGYPQRMRDYTARDRARRRRESEGPS